MDWFSYLLGLLTIPALLAALGLAYVCNEAWLTRRKRSAEELDLVNAGEQPLTN